MDYPPDSIKSFLNNQYGLVIHAIEKFGQGVLNTNLLCKASAQKYVFRIYNFKKPDTVQYEVDILEFLKDKNFPCPRLQQTKNGDLVVLFRGKPCVVYGYIDGTYISKLNVDLLEEIGKIMGRL